MRGAVVVGEFPVLSETFILNQITSLIDRQHEIDIYALKRGSNLNVHAEVVRRRLCDKTYYYQANTLYGKATRILGGAGSMLLNELISPGLFLRSLDVARSLFNISSDLSSLQLLHVFVARHRKR